MCTGLRLTCADGNVVHGRTVEFAVELDLDVLHVPVGTAFTSALTDGPGASWTTTHSALGVGRDSAEAIMDGVNDAGLCAGAFYFPGTADYSEDDGGSDAIAPQDFVHWILTTCATIDEVRDRVHDVRVVGSNAPEWGGVPPFHYVVYDADGTAVVIEPVGKGLAVSDNPFGSVTNSPEFDFHLKNLSQYMEVDPTTVRSVDLGGHPITGFSAGTGSLGLPGDFTSPSRFVRATMFSAHHDTPRRAADGVQEVFHLLNQFDIPRGFVTVAENGAQTAEWTLGTVARDPSARDYYYRSYGDQSLRKMNLTELDASQPSGISRVSMGPSGGAETAVSDMTDAMASATA